MGTLTVEKMNRKSYSEEALETANHTRWGKAKAQLRADVAASKLRWHRLAVVGTLAVTLASGARGARYPIDTPLPATSGAQSDRVPEIVFNSATSVQDVPQWLVVGPFRQSNGQPAERWQDVLAPIVGKPEHTLTVADLDTLAKRLATDSHKQLGSLQAVLAGGPTNQIYFNDALGLSDVPPTGETRIVYACCQIDCSESEDAALFTRSDGRVKLWLNGEVLLTHDKPGDKYAEKYREVSIIHLGKGTNLLVAHVVYDSEACGFWAGLTLDISTAIQRVADAPDQTLTDAWCMRAGSSVLVDVPVFGVSRPQIKVVWRGKTVSQAEAGQSLAVPASWNDSGVSYLKTEISGVTISQPIFIGDPATAAKRYRGEYATIESRPGSEHLYAALFRCEHLVEPEHFKPEDLDWQRKFATQAAVFEEGVEPLRRGVNPFRYRVGKYFRAYRSAIDGAMQYSLVYVPRQASRIGGRLPVVLLTPAVVQNVRPFLSSVYAANGGDWASFRMAEQFGCIVVLPSGRNNAYGNPIGLADMREAVRSLDSDLPVDWKRVSIQGWCSGGLFALMLATFYPNDYSAVVVNNTMAVRNKNMYPAGSERLPVPVAKDWLVANNPFPLSANLDRVSLLMVHHDVEEEPYNEPAYTLQTPLYAADMKRAGLPVTVHCFHRPGYYRCDETELTFQWCVAPKEKQERQKAVLVTAQTKYGNGLGICVEEQERSLAMSRIEAEVSTPQRLEISTLNIRQVAVDLKRFGLANNTYPTLVVDGQIDSGERLVDGWVRLRTSAEAPNPIGKSTGLEGPLSYMLARPFVITVEGTSNNATRAARRWCEQFRSQWRKDFFCDCRFKPLEELTREDWRNFDVLVFCVDPKRLLPGTGSEERFRLTQDGVNIGGKRINGSAIGVLALWRNPQWPDHFIAVATSNDFNHCEFPDVNFAFEGWFDYLVWQTPGTKRIDVLKADRFDSDWR